MRMKLIERAVFNVAPRLQNGRVLATVLLGGVLTGCGAPAMLGFGDAEQRQWEREIRDWQQQREARLREPFGWLSLVGLEELQPGVTSVGSGDDMDLVVPGGPGHWGNLIHTDNQVRFDTSPGVNVRINGHLMESALLESNGDSGPTLVEAGSVQFHLIERGGQPWVRVRDSQAETRLQFAGLQRFPIDFEWRIEADFLPHPPGQTMPIANVLGDIGAEPNPGQVRFERDGREFSMEAVRVEDGRLWLIFADRTSGRESYGLGRFLYTDAPRGNRVVVDFNRAYNPPCAFTEYSTCPLPPQSNRLDLRVTAGEMTYPAAR